MSQKFELGLTFTGTVSAGAYTAGVIDFIIDAMDEWEKEKAENRRLHGEDHSKWTVPWHDVVIRGISGASGGGVSCGLILNNIGKNTDRYTPIRTPDDIGKSNDFYDAWVNLLGIEQLLDTKDIDNNSSIKSAFNADAIPDVAEALLKVPNFGSTPTRSYIADNLLAIITLTNLRGIPYVLNYNGEQVKKVTYKRHADYAKFELSKNSTSAYLDTYVVPYDTSNPLFPVNYTKLKEACLGTCAFPVAFKAQPFHQNPVCYGSRPFNIALAPMPSPYDFLNNDGGILNTEPFQLLHDALLPVQANPNPNALEEEATKHNPPNAEDVIRSIIMVAPLQLIETTNQPVYDIAKDDLLDVAPDVITAIRNEALFSAEQIGKAFEEDIYSRFMIAPSRSSNIYSNDFVTPAITGTVLETFGAFISKDFRQHDYFMGRRNAQQFFRKHFAVPVDKVLDNPVFGPLNIRQQYPLYVFSDTDGDFFPIIPLCGAVKPDAYFPAWPTKKGYDLDDIQDRLAKRVDQLTTITESSLDLKWWKRKLFELFVLGNVKDSIVNGAIKSISKALDDAKL